MPDFIHSLTTLDPVWVYAAIFAIAFSENIFPPLPSDVAVVFGGALAALDRGNPFLALLAGAAGSTLGFMTMYGIGRWFGRRILESGKLPFIPAAAVHRLEAWFARYGYWIIVGNRFLAGTRAVVSFFAGLSELPPVRTCVLSALSALVWNGVLVYAGYALGANWESVGSYLSAYSQVVTGVVILVAIVVYVRTRRRKKPPTEPER